MGTELDADRSALSRRTVLRTGMWAVPVLAVAVATPLAAASLPAAACLVYDGTGQLEPFPGNGDTTVSAAAVAAVTAWLTDSSLPWPTAPSVLTVEFVSVLTAELDGQPYSLTAIGSSTEPLPVLSDGSIPGSGNLLQAAVGIAYQDYLAKQQDPQYPSGLTWTTGDAPEVSATLQFAYSADCTLPLTLSAPAPVD